MNADFLRKTRCCSLVAAAVAAVWTAPAALAVGDVVISQVYGGATTTGTSGAPNADYIELFNRTGSPVSLNGWSINVDTPTGTSWTKHDLPNVSIPPFSYYLIRVSATVSTAGTVAYTADTVFAAPINSELTSTTGKVALRNTTTPIGAVACPPIDAALVDLVTYGTSGTCREGAANAPAASTTNAVFRRGDGCTDTDENGLDFVARLSSFRNLSTPALSACSTGSCCSVTTGQCFLDTASNCNADGHVFIGASCTPSPCDPSGACCSGTTGTTCTAPLTSAGCAALTNGIFLGINTTCTSTPCASGSCCSPSGAGGTCCSTMFPGLCTQQGNTPGPGGSTCTSVGNCIPAPANDLCANAILIPSAGTLMVGNNFAATQTGDGPAVPSETSASNKGVWFKFVPAATSVYDISACGTTFDSMIQAFTIGDCTNTATWAYVGGDDDDCAAEPAECAASGSAAASIITGVGLTAGQQIYIRVGIFGTSATGGGNFHLVINDVGGTFGACCIAANGQCELRSALGCSVNGDGGTGTPATGGTFAGVYQGDNTTCSPSPCTTVFGACCFSGGVCAPRPPASCTGTNVYNGDGSTCFPSPCITGACCSSTGTCTTTLPPPSACTAAGSAYLGDDTVCSPDPCPKGACCSNTTGACTITAPATQGGCASGTFSGTGTVCTAGSNPCVPANDECGGAIVLVDHTELSGSTFGATQSANATLCSTGLDVFYKFTPPSTGTYRVLLTPSTTSLSLAIGTICPTFDDDIVCITSSTTARNSGPLTLTGGTTYYIRPGISGTTASGATFALIIDSTATGACCNNTTGVCTLAAAIDGCATTATYQGDGTSCSPDPCPKGACCNLTSGACTITAPSSSGGCSTGQYQGDASTCDPNPCPQGGACCNPCTNACTTTVEGACISPSVWHSAVACSPTNICTTFGSAPANDLACNAITLTVGAQVTGNMLGATDTNDGGTVTNCGTTGTPGPALWYKYTTGAAESGYFGLTTCGTTFDDTMAVLTGDCNDVSTMTVVACDDDTCAGGTTDPVICGTGSSSTLGAVIGFVYFDPNTTYYIRVRAYINTTVGGTFPLTLSTVIAGACCSTAGTCTQTLQSGCTGTSVFQGDNTTCATTSCPPAGSCCAACTFACTTTLQSSCASGSTWTEAGTCTAPTTCIQVPAPSNDLPCNPIALTLDNAVTGTLFSATSAGDGLNSTCDTTATRGVWYSFSPATTGDYTFGTCGSTFGTVLTVLSGDCNNPDGMTILDCDDDTCTGTGDPVACSGGSSSTAASLIDVVNLTQGTTYYVRVQVDGTGTGTGTFSVVVRAAISGSCCASSTACTETIQDLCASSSLWTAGQVCSTSPCANLGSCCNTVSFACSLTTAAGCVGPNLDYGAGNTCASAGVCGSNDDCPGPVLNLHTLIFSSTTGATPGAGTSPSCSISGCEDTWFDFTAPFDDTFNFHCIQLANGEPVISLWPDCSLTGELACLSGGRLSPTTPDITLPFAMTAGQHIKVRISSYACIDGPYSLEVNSTLPSGACCNGSACSVQLQSACTVGFQGVNSVCNPNPCTPPGVCCRGATCTTAITSSAACTSSLSGALAGAAFPNGAACNGVSTINPCCYPDYNKVGGITVGDIFDFLNDWFAGRKFALVGGDGDNGTLAVQNIFDFLNAWFAGGC